MMKLLLLLAALVPLLAATVAARMGDCVEDVTSFTPLRQVDNGVLYRMDTKRYEVPPMVAVLHGSHYDIGYAHGALLAHEIVETQESLMNFLVPPHMLPWLKLFLDWQWSFFLSHNVPSELLDEIRGLEAGGVSVGVPNLSLTAQRATVISTLPGDTFDNVFYLLMDEIIESGTHGMDGIEGVGGEQDIAMMIKTFSQMLALLKQTPWAEMDGGHCSVFATWGSRSADNVLWTGRNLDWQHDTGICKHKLVMVTKPTGKIASAHLVYPGMIAGLAAISEQGIVVTETGEDVQHATFWGLNAFHRLRHGMENCKDLACMMTYWNSTRGTLGNNHILTSVHDHAAGRQPAIALEAMRDYTAVFADNDPREETSIPDAVFRTNHAYDPYVRSLECHPPKHPSVDEEYDPSMDDYRYSGRLGIGSMGRYRVIWDLFHKFEAEKRQIDLEDALEILASAGAHGDDPHSCPDAPAGSNILSVLYRSQTLDMWVAWESGHGANWRSASCTCYLHISLAQFLR